MFAKVLPLGFYVAAMVVAAVEYYGKNAGYDGASTNEKGAHRMLAEVADTYATTSDYTTTTTDVPIWLICGASIASTLWQWTMIVLCFPSGGRHKEYVARESITLVMYFICSNL
jgi:hypothetical protein